MKWFRILMSVLVVACVVGLGFHIYNVKQYNEELTQNFQYTKYTHRYDGYKNQVPMEEMDFSELGKSIPRIVAADLSNYPVKFTVKKDIYYYTEPDKKSEIVHVIHKGDVLVLDCDKHDIPEFSHRIETWPTYEARWRYGIPLCAVSDDGRCITSFGLNWEDVYGYITTEDMLYILACFKRAYFDLMREIGNEVTIELRKTTAIIYMKDTLLYDRGMYLSPDLYKSYWDKNTITLLIGAVIFTTAGVLDFIFRKQKRLLKNA